MSTVATLAYSESGSITTWIFDHNEIRRIESFLNESQIKKELQDNTPVKYVVGPEWYNFIIHFKQVSENVFNALWDLKDKECFITFTTFYKNGTQNLQKHVKINPDIIFPFKFGLLDAEEIIQLNLIEAVSGEIASDIIHDQYVGV